MAMSRIALLAAGCSIAVAAGSTVYAQTTPSPTPTPMPAATTDTDHHDDDDIWHFKVFGGPAYVAPLNDSDISFETVTDSIQAQDHIGWKVIHVPDLQRTGDSISCPAEILWILFGRDDHHVFVLI